LRVSEAFAFMPCPLLEHYAGYMKATARAEPPYLEIAESLKKKRQGKAEPEPRAAKTKRA
jgi:hypothetical protein